MTIDEAIKVINPDEHDPRAVEILNRFDDLNVQQAFPPNAPLIIEQLQQMVKEPVWVCNIDGTHGAWMINYGDCCMNFYDIEHIKDYGKIWIAYRYKPEET